MNVAIIGCGPAGLAAALLIHRSGHKVTLLERFAAPQPTGSGIILQPTGLAVLRELGLAADVLELGHRIDRIAGFAHPSGRIVLDVDYRALGVGFHGVAVHRAALFDTLFGAVGECAIEVRTAAEILSLEARDSGHVAVDIQGIRHGPYDLIVDASGAASQFSPHSPPRQLQYGALWGSFDLPRGVFPDNCLGQRYVGAHTMIGVLPIGRHAHVDRDQVAFFWSLKTDEYAAWKDQGLDTWKRQVVAIWPDCEAILEQIRDPSQLTLARYGHRTLRKPYAKRLAIIGDAAHATSPQLGQGANMALLDAWCLHDALQQCDSVDQALRLYARSRWWHVRAFQLSSLLMTPFYQSNSRLLAWGRDLLFYPVSRLPLIRRVVAGLISGMLAGPPKSLSYEPPYAE